MIEKKTKCSEMALPVSFNLLIVEQHNTITKTVSCKMFGTLCKLSRSFNTARDFFWAAMIWGSRASNFDDCPKIVFHVCPQNFQETLKKKWSPAISTVFFVDVVFVLFYASQWCFEAWQWFFCDSWLPSGKTQEKRWSQVNQIFQTLIECLDIVRIIDIYTGCFLLVPPPNSIKDGKSPTKKWEWNSNMWSSNSNFHFLGGHFAILNTFWGPVKKHPVVVWPRWRCFDWEVGFLWIFTRLFRPFSDMKTFQNFACLLYSPL